MNISLIEKEPEKEKKLTEIEKIIKFMDNVEERNNKKTIEVDLSNFKKSKKGVILKCDNFKPAPKHKDTDDYIEAPNNFLPRPPFSIQAIAKKGSGKSTTFYSFLELYKDFFEIVVLITPTITMDLKNNDVIKLFNIPEEHCYTKYREEIVKQYMNEAKKINRLKKRKEQIPFLIIIDDSANDMPAKLRDSVLNRLAMNHRHYNISFMLVSQYLSCLPPTVRTQSTCSLLWAVESSREVDKIIENFASDFERDEFKRIYEKATFEKYSFLAINSDAPLEYKYSYNFNEQIPEYLDILKRKKELIKKRKAEKNNKKVEEQVIEKVEEQLEGNEEDIELLWECFKE